LGKLAEHTSARSTTRSSRSLQRKIDRLTNGDSPHEATEDSETSMRLLLLHCEHFEYTTREEAIKNPEPLENNERGNFQNVLVGFCTIEKEDEADPQQVAL
jgi:hypothetical protein